MLALLLVEPYKRRKLAQTLEARLVRGEETARGNMQTTMDSIDKRLERIDTSGPAGEAVTPENASRSPALGHAPAPASAAPSTPSALRRPSWMRERPAWVGEITAFWTRIRAAISPYFARMQLPSTHGEDSWVVPATAGVAIGAYLLCVLQTLML